MKSYKELMDELLKDEKFKEIYLKKEALYHFLDEIIKLRKEKNYSLRKLAEITGIKYSNLSRIENGKQNISYETMWNLTNALDGKLYITPNGENIIELSDKAMKQLNEIVKDEKKKSEFIETLIENYYKNKDSIEEIQQHLDIEENEAYKLIIGYGINNWEFIMEREFEEEVENRWNEEEMEMELLLS